MSHSIRVRRRAFLAGAGAVIAGAASARAGQPAGVAPKARGPKIGGTAAYNIRPSLGNPYFYPLGTADTTTRPTPPAYSGKGLQYGRGLKKGLQQGQ